MLTYLDLKPGTCISMDGQPYVVLEAHFLRKQQRKPVVQTKIRNLISKQVLEKSFHPADKIEEADLETKEVKFLYSHRDEFWFCPPDNPANRFKLEKEVIGPGTEFLKNNSVVPSVMYNEEIIGIRMPIKMDLKVVEAAPAVRGNTAQGATKIVKLETGATISVPLFINEGDIVRVNTERSEYVERAEKSK